MSFSFRRRFTLMLGLAVMLTGLFASAALLPEVGETSDHLACQQAPTETDLDCDGLSDEVEKAAFQLEYLRDQNDQIIRVRTKINDPDTDGDGLCDGEEFDGFKVVTSSLGQDGKPIELTRQTNPDNEDTDGDGFSDGTERDKGTDPRDLDDFPPADPPPTSTPKPTATSAQTQQRAAAPTATPRPTPAPRLDADSDGDGLTNGAERGGFTVTINGQEITMVTDPENPDTDGDNLPDEEEVGGGHHQSRRCRADRQDRSNQG